MKQYVVPEKMDQRQDGVGKLKKLGAVTVEGFHFSPGLVGSQIQSMSYAFAEGNVVGVGHTNHNAAGGLDT